MSDWESVRARLEKAMNAAQQSRTHPNREAMNPLRFAGPVLADDIRAALQRVEEQDAWAIAQADQLLTYIEAEKALRQWVELGDAVERDRDRLRGMLAAEEAASAALRQRVEELERGDEASRGAAAGGRARGGEVMAKLEVRLAVSGLVQRIAALSMSPIEAESEILAVLLGVSTELREENARLRAALKEILDHVETQNCDVIGAIQEARAALRGPEEKP